MFWLSDIVDEIEKRHKDGEIIVSSGVSPSGTYHLGTLREVLTAEAISRELMLRGRNSKHIHVVDDLDVFRKVPVGLPAEYEKHLGMPLCDIKSPDGSGKSYADYYLADLIDAAGGLRLEMKIMRAHQKYREGFFVPAIEKALDSINDIRKILEDVSGHRLGEEWSPVQVVEDGYLKNRKFVGLVKAKKEITYEDKDSKEQVISYKAGLVKLNWRIDWPARWWLLGVDVEPFGRDHATKGGSYDTGVEIARKVYGAQAPLPVPYNFINRTGDTKKMSKSKGDTVTAAELLKVLPPEIVWYFILRYPPAKLLFFDQGPTLMKLFDDFAALSAKMDKSEDDKKLLELCTYGLKTKTISRIPFSHLVASYQAALRDPVKTLEVMKRTEHAKTVEEDHEVIKRELKYIHNWLDNWAPDDVKFDVLSDLSGAKNLSKSQEDFLRALVAKIGEAPKDADGNWFHEAIYSLKDEFNMQPKDLFSVLYQVLIGKDSGPRAGWFLSILPREWLVKRLDLKE